MNKENEVHQILKNSPLSKVLAQKDVRLSGDISSSSVDNLNLGLIQETYSGSFENDLKRILKDKPLTFENLHIALKENKLACKQIKRIISKIYSNQEKVDAIYKIFKNLENNQKELDDYCSKKFIHPMITRDKAYLEMKGAIESSRKFLAEKYHIKNKTDMQKKIQHSQKRLSLVSKLHAKLHKLKVKERSYIVLSVKKLVKKVKGSIVSLHPELKQFLDFLSFEQISNLKILREDFNFLPKSIDDFAKEIKTCKIKMKKDPNNKEYYGIMLKLLDSVSSDYYKNYTHSKNLEKGYTREQTDDRVIPYGDMNV